MEYFVITPTGQRFGPADFQTLILWVQQGRIDPNTMLQEVSTGRQMMANQIPGLGLPASTDYYQGVHPSPKDYPRIVETKGDKLANTAKALGITGFFLCPLFCLVGIGFAAMAFQNQSPKAKSAMIVCVGALVLQVVLYGLFYGLIMASLSSLKTGF